LCKCAKQGGECDKLRKFNHFGRLAATSRQVGIGKRDEAVLQSTTSQVVDMEEWAV
jgi:hypothetical protein